MLVNTSRILTLDGKVPRLYVSNPEILQATPLSPNQVQVSALKPGVAQLNLWNESGQIFCVDVVVMRNAAELIDLLRSEFPEATLHVRPLAHSVYITGFVPRASMLDEIISLAKDYYPNVINGITVGGVQQVALHVKVMEVSRTKLRQLGLDWTLISDNFEITQGAAGVLANRFSIPGSKPGADTVRFKVLGTDADLEGFLQALRQQDLVKLLAEPTLITMTGRPACFNSGGSFPVLIPNGLGTVGVNYREYGTRVDFVPIVLGNGMIRLEVRPSVSEVDETRGVELNGIRVPGLTERFADASVELRAGQTLALAGLIQNRVEAQNRGVPVLADLPWVGRAFSRVEERVNEVELLIMVTPELVGPLDPHQVPQCGPGQLTSNPNDCELYSYGYMEVPNCCLLGDRPACQGVNGVPSAGCGPVYAPAGSGPRPYATTIPERGLPRDVPSIPPSSAASEPAGTAAPQPAQPPVQQPTQPVPPGAPAAEQALFGGLGYDSLR